tara:strand:- start:507 stop:701 length:195 start_codon:yes stop_codon:yes gene_type:complete
MMSWRELHNVILTKAYKEPTFMDLGVTVYDAADGEYYLADTLELQESDGILDAGHMFISVNVKG